MDTDILTPEMIKSANPGIDDFGGGTLVIISSQCLRCTKETLECTICSDVCPVGGIDTSFKGRPNITNKCIKCGVCATACPGNALAPASKSARQLSRLNLQASLRSDHLVFGCERTAAMLRLQMRTTDQAAAIAGLGMLKEARNKEQLITLPCLAIMSKEMWFSILNEIGQVMVEAVSVLLPTEQCSLCPANANGAAEEAFSNFIEVAEAWSGQTVGIVERLEDLPKKKLANVREFLAKSNQVDRRSLFTGFVSELKQSWEANTTVGNKALEEAQIQRARRESFGRTRMSEAQKEKVVAGARPIETSYRYLLVEALGRNDEHAADVAVSVSQTNLEICRRCDACVRVCPVRARKVYKEQIYVNEIYCLGCSACLQVCPHEACSFKEIDGYAFLCDDGNESKTEA